MTGFSRRASLEWIGDVRGGSGSVAGDSNAFRIPATFPRVTGDPAGTTTPEELLAASHATCYGIGLRSIIAQRGGRADRIRVTSTITADKARGRIVISAAHIEGVVEGLTGIEAAQLHEIARAAEDACTISGVLRASVPLTVDVRAI